MNIHNLVSGELVNRTSTDIETGGLIGGSIGGLIEQFIADFGTLAFRKMIDSEMNKEILVNNFGLFSVYFRSNFGVNSDEIQTKLGVSSLFTLALITIDKTATAKTMAEMIGARQRTIENHIAKLRENEIIKRHGSDKTGHYEICKQ